MVDVPRASCLGRETACVAHGSSSFRSRFTPIAIGFDAFAVVGLVLTVLAAFLRGDALGLVVPGLALGSAVLPGRR